MRSDSGSGALAAEPDPGDHVRPEDAVLDGAGNGVADYPRRVKSTAAWMTAPSVPYRRRGR